MDFDPAFANLSADRRPPTAGEIDNGFPCGPLDIQLWNWLFWMITAELQEVVTFGGITPDNASTTTLRRAIEALIAAATGGGDTSQFLLVSQARARLPIFPDVQTALGTFGVFSPAPGTIRIPAAVNFSHRGIYPLVTTLTDIASNISKTYHLRYNFTTAVWALKDLADTAVYNPAASAEDDPKFDSTYDDMLVARVITNASNVATIVELSNRATLRKVLQQSVTPVHNVNHAWVSDFSIPINWARTPSMCLGKASIAATATGTPSAHLQGGANHFLAEAWTRYLYTSQAYTDWDSNPAGFTIISSTLRGGAID